MNSEQRSGDRTGTGSVDLTQRIRVARGEEEGDLLLTGGRIVNVFTQRIETGNVVLCDGSVRMVNYTIEAEIHVRLGNRKDGLVIDQGKF